MRAMVPSPPTTRADCVLANSGTRPVKQLGIKLVGLAIDVEIGAREAGGDQRRAKADDGLEQLIDVAIL